MGSLLPDQTIDDVVARIKQSNSNPNVRSITQVVLKGGPKAYRVATLMEVINPATQTFHHYSLRIDQIDRNKQGWFYKPEKSVRLEGKEPNEIEALYRLLAASEKDELRGKDGEVHLIRGNDYAKVERLLEALPNLADADKLHLVKQVIAELDGTTSTIGEFTSTFESTNEQVLRHIATASRLVQYRAALNHLKDMVATHVTSESQYQDHLASNPWLFGSEYSELLERRNWTRDDRLDYMLRRTVDNYLEIVEIKTAFSDPLFIHDSARDSYYPSSKLSPVIGQAMRYIEEVERDRDSILAKDDADTLKIRARIIVGRDHTPNQQAALRNLNAHMHRIEVITFDQLVRTGERVLSMFHVEDNPDTGHSKAESDGDIPF